MDAPRTLPPPLSYRDVLRLPVMRRVWYAQVVSLAGDALALFAVIAVATFRMHATPAEVTGVQIAFMLPFVFLGPLSGVLVDRWPLKPTLVGSDLVRAALVVLLVVATELWQVYAVLAALAAVSTFFFPAQSVTIRSHVPPHGLIAANALMQIASMGVRVAGPLAAGALVSVLGPDICYAIDAASFVVSAALIGSVAIVRPENGPASAPPTGGRVRSILREMSEGMRFLGGHAALLFVVLAMAAGLFTVGCFGPLIAIYIRESLHQREVVFGIASAMVGVGLLAGTTIIRRLAARLANDTMILGGLVGIAGALVILSAVPHVAATLLGTFVMGFAFSAIMVPAQTLMQRETPAALLGRISSTVTSVVLFAQLLGLFVSGAASQLLSVRTVFFLSAVLALVLAAAGHALLRSRAPAPT